MHAPHVPHVHRSSTHLQPHPCRLLDALADSLGTDRAFFRAKFERPMLFLRPLRYSPERSDPGAGVYGAGAHTDYGMLTILATDGTPGLQILRGRTWHEVPPRPGALVINLGDMCERYPPCPQHAMWCSGACMPGRGADNRQRLVDRSRSRPHSRLLCSAGVAMASHTCRQRRGGDYVKSVHAWITRRGHGACANA